MANSGKIIITKLNEFYINPQNGEKIYLNQNIDNLEDSPFYFPPEDNLSSCPIPPLSNKKWIGEELTSYCEDIGQRQRIWIGDENTSYCELENNSYLPITLSLSIESLTPTTNNASNGQVLFKAENGIGPYLYSIDNINWQGVPLFINLSAGNYFGIVQDFTNNQKIINFKIL